MSILSASRDSVRTLSTLPPWQRAMKQAVRDPGELCRMLNLPQEIARAAIESAGSFGLFVPRQYLKRMRPGDPHDPLLRQVLPLTAEAVTAPGFTYDPVADAAAARAPGLLEKYRGRILIVATGACAVHCRYCFRRHYPYAAGPRSLPDWQEALEQIESDASIHEVILSGGDPLTQVDEVLSELAHRLAEIAHVRRLRVHTRLPIMIPERINDSLLSWLCGTRLTPIVVVHANHPAELGGEVDNALARLVDAGTPVLNQAVLLRGVNDSVAALAELCEHLVDLRVLPYYLHQLDRVAGAAHFEVPETEGLELMAQLRVRLPGYALPRYVREQPGAASKIEVA